MKLPELKRRFKNKYVIRIAAGVLTIAVAGGSAGVYTVNAAKTSTKAETPQESTDKKDKKDNKDDEEDLKEVLSSKISKAADEEVGKEETVYVVADNSGKAKDVIVSDWLKNPDGNETIEDVSDLKDIKNVKGKEKFEEKDGKITWKAKGKDIYYQGKTDKELPVKQTISYYLDGEKMDPDEIAGKSGKVTIRFDYKNNQKTTTTVDGKKYSVYVPFTIMTGMILDDSFTNVEVKNGKVISDGDKNMVVGVAMPGLKDSLKVTSSDFSEDIDIPEYVEVTADVKDFSMDMTMSVMLSGITSSDNVEDFVDLSDLDDAIDTLSDSSSQLADGTKELREGLEQLRSKVPALADGANTLNSSTESLRNGVSSLDATLNTAMTEEEKAAASKQASETVDAQADSIKKQAADTVASQKKDIEKKASDAVDAQADSIKKQAADTVASQKKSIEKQASDTVDKQADSIKKQAADTVASQKESIEKQASATVDAQAEAIKKQAADTVAAQQAEIAKQAEALVTAQEADIKSQADQLVDAEAGNIQKLAAAAVKAEFDAGQRQAIADQAKATTTSTVSTALRGNAQLLSILKAGIKANVAAGGGSISDEDATAQAYQLIDAMAVQIGEGAAPNVAAACENAATQAAQKAAVTGAKQGAEKGAVAGAKQGASQGAVAGATLAAQQAAVTGAKQGAAAGAVSGATAAAQQAAVTGAKSGAAAGAVSGATAAAQQAAITGAKSGAAQGAVTGATEAAQTAALSGAKSGAAQGAIAGAESAKKTVAAGIEAVQSNGYSLVTGMDALKNGTQALADQVPALTDGVGKLADGSVTLNEGMVKFDEEGIQKLADTYNGDVKGMLNKVVAVMQAGSDYQSFSDISEDTLGEVKFIIRTEGVGTDED